LEGVVGAVVVVVEVDPVSWTGSLGGERVSFRDGELVKKTRRNHAPAFKAKVALEAAREEATITELSRKYGLHTRAIRAWKEQLLSGAVGLFASGVEVQRDQDDLVKGLHAKIGELTVERDFLSRALKR
jgi:transposase-like protein